MKTQFYIRVDATKPPEEDDDYITDFGQLQYSPDDEVWHVKIDDYWETFNPKWYLQEISISEFLMEFEVWKIVNIHENFLLDSFEIIESFLTQKGYIIKD